MTSTRSLVHICYVLGLSSQLALAAPTRNVDCCQSIAQVLPANVHFSNDTAYATSLGSYWAAQESDSKPACIVTPQNPQHVATALRTISDLDQSRVSCLFAVRAGGHGKSGNSNQGGGVDIDLSALAGVQLSNDKKTVNVGVGARWQQVYETLDPDNITVAGGRDGTVGVGGLSLAGGISYYAPQVGFACDNVLTHEIVLATGEVITASSDQHQDLHRALRGSGNNFGIVTSVTVATIPQGNLWGGTTYHAISTVSEQIETFYKFVADPQYDEKASMYQSFGYAQNNTVVLNNLAYTEPTTELPEKLAVFADIQPQLFNTSRVSNMTAFADEQAVASPKGFRQITYTLTIKNNLDVLKASFDIWNATLTNISATPGLQYSWSLEPIVPAITSKSAVRGANVLGLDPSAGPLVLCLLSATYANAADDTTLNQAAQGVISGVYEKAKANDADYPWLYAGYAAKGQDVIASYGEQNVAFLKKVAGEYDAKGVFQRLVPGGFKLGDE